MAPFPISLDVPTMTAWIPALEATALCLSLLWLVVALSSRPRSALAWVWAGFCASIAMMLARGLVGPEATGWYLLLGLGACFTCNGFWLVSRALFRPGRPFGTPHLVYVGVVAGLIVTFQQRAALPPALAGATGELLNLLSSGALVMAFWEGLRGWRQQRGMERTVRTVFMATFGGCVGLNVVLAALVDPAMQAVGAAGAAFTILLVTQGLVAWRLRHPLPAPGESPHIATPPARMDSSAEARADALLRTEDVALAQVLEQHMRSQRPYLQPELKLGHLATALEVGEYRISRAIRGPLGHRNINQYVNAYRLEHARALLLDSACDDWSTLVVGLESGFGSLGAFNRAFKAAEGCPPGEYRAARGASGSVAPLAPDPPCRGPGFDPSAVPNAAVHPCRTAHPSTPAG